MFEGFYQLLGFCCLPGDITGSCSSYFWSPPGAPLELSEAEHVQKGAQGRGRGSEARGPRSDSSPVPVDKSPNLSEPLVLSTKGGLTRVTAHSPANLQAALRAHVITDRQLLCKLSMPPEMDGLWQIHLSCILCTALPPPSPLSSPPPPQPLSLWEVRGKVTSQGPRMSWEGGWQQEPAIAMTTGP